MSYKAHIKNKPFLLSFKWKMDWHMIKPIGVILERSGAIQRHLGSAY